MVKPITNWGKYPAIKASEEYFRSTEELQAKLAITPNYIARGAGRCYGDASLAPVILNASKYNKLLSFNQQTGVLRCQAGTTLDELITAFVPKGWFLPVTPGTKFITVGGAVASDVHGKNHHKDGSFSQHVSMLSIMLDSGEVISCSPNSNADLFDATCGGMGLTGFILEVEFKLLKIETAYIRQKQIKADNLQQVFELFESHEDSTYSVAWIDCLQTGKKQGRSILLLGEHAKLDDLPTSFQPSPLVIAERKKLNVPFDLPSITLNSYSVKAFNFAYYHKQSANQIESIVDFDSYFYPLDFVHNWNRIYGPSGFVQYQCVLPMENSYKGLQEILSRINAEKGGSFLAVLKLFGEQNTLMGFPMRGYTLALDFPVKRGLFKFLEELDKVVHGLGGRIYLSKDARMSKQSFTKGYPNYKRFLEIRETYAQAKPQSLLSERLMPTL